ncbi:FMN-binding protein [Oceanispirochaeta crateris]|uniref:FMN-binding protein n=1 Tax=Oceanispirochaeta crateris TaxID=2518645 RepID=A0A5C1QPW8_9SPIO|nr:FMN-binding protein [Oceanispirochaeta crateris]QEN09537.1 FMN-binding protein [Oceanispirochaeta crateris]
MKKTIFLMTVLIMVSTGLFALNQKDGVYFAQEKSFPDSGWKYNVTVVVKNGKITSAIWNGSNVNAGDPKVVVSKDGRYGMEAKGGAMAPWWKQAQAVEQQLIKSQDINSIILSDKEGHTDTVSGASIHVAPFVNLVKEAFAAGPVGYGPYKDGTYKAEEAAFDHGYKYFVEVTVTSGYIVAVNWDAYAEKGGKNKAQSSIDGEYGMQKNGGAMAPWWQQARAIEDSVINSQTVNQPDAISGASIGLDPFYTLLNKALSKAKR